MFNEDYFIKDSSLFAIRFNQLWMQEIKQISQEIKPFNNIATGDVILVTGGLGGIALENIKFISKHHKVKFILVSRNNIVNTAKQTKLTKYKLDLLDKIVQNGCEIDIQCMDIADESAVQNLLNYITTKYKTINGVIHAAGVIPLSSDKVNLSNIKDVFRGKVYGIYNIINNISNENLKFIVCTSSLSSILGDINRFEYCASNAYLDYMSFNHLQLKQVNFISINWPGWSETGMVLNVENNENTEKLQLNLSTNLVAQNAVTNKEGAELFYKLINQRKQNQIIISKIDLDYINTMLFSNEKVEISKNDIKINETEYTQIEYSVAQIFGELLGIDTVSLDDNFFNLGGNSLLAVKLIAKLSIINIKLNLNEIIEVNSIKKICQFQQENNKDNSIIVPLSINNKHSSNNVFFIHAVGGTVIEYKKIADQLLNNYNY
jgi:NAD(P)-dependent dehydrogenase (short-subunit alcohol dehydrogenase family)